MKYFALKMADGSVAVMQLLEGTDPYEEIKKWPEDQQAGVVSVTEINEADIPKDRSERTKWRLEGSTIKVDK